MFVLATRARQRIRSASAVRASLTLVLSLALLMTGQGVARAQVSLSGGEDRVGTPSVSTGVGGHTSALGASSDSSVSAAPSGAALTSPQPSKLSQVASRVLYDSFVRPLLFDYGVGKGLYHMVK